MSISGVTDLEANNGGGGGGGSEANLILYGTSSGVAMGSNSTVLSYTVPSGSTLELSTIMISSDSVSQWIVQFSASTEAVKRLSFCSFNDAFIFGGIKIYGGQTITVIGTNESMLGPAQFDATLLGNIE